MTTLTDVTAPSTRRGWNDEDHPVWGLVRDPEAVFLPLVIGAVALGIALWDDFAWFGRLGQDSNPTYAGVRDFVATQSGPRQLVPQLYFAGGAVALGALALVAALVTMVTSAGGRTARAVAILASALGVAATLGAAQLDRSVPFGTWLSRADIAFWGAVAGFGLLFVAAVLVRPAPRR